VKLVLLTLESSKELWFEEAALLYEKKISNLADFEIQKIKSKASAKGSSKERVLAEEKLLLSKLDSNDFAILFDEKGKSWDSIQFSSQISKAMDSGKKKVFFIIGGAYGVSDEVKKRANLTLSLSSMTFNHFVAQLVVLEQIYRALAIRKGLPYHHG
jgi:23S rRNA (pseudouridine1915-N3)-methyltransferase